MLENIIPFVHSVLGHAIGSGDTVVDGTAGNGHDTVFLARCVGDEGRVLAFDVQAVALAATSERLLAHGLDKQVQLIHDGHEHLAAYAPTTIQAALFNFGYRPGGEKTATTRAETSLIALRTALSLLKSGGMMAAVLYPGHPEGQREAAAIVDWAATLPQQQVAVLRYGFINRVNAPPFAMIIEKY
ncbi:class I SAM-dependent methyltransferase [Snodgrassella sp. CFCC 13594]|uniref:class I SAM-dependent methyltransferase n=1 Tax=Snodgrassella sp. CFCC 13594 TaxID=1775559 RepID=UPI00082A9960|nr:class I SAM-dependent methyltransferase [Snodgrassella sp. CFCC 13594]